MPVKRRRSVSSLYWSSSNLSLAELSQEALTGLVTPRCDPLVVYSLRHPERLSSAEPGNLHGPLRPSATADKQGAIALHARMWRQRNDATIGPAGRGPRFSVCLLRGDIMANRP